METAPDALVVTRGKGKIALVNTQTEELFGYSREELLGQDVEMLMPERMRHRHTKSRADYFRHPVRRPMGKSLESFGVRKDGTEFPVEISLSPIVTGRGNTCIRSHSGHHRAEAGRSPTVPSCRHRQRLRRRHLQRDPGWNYPQLESRRREAVRIQSRRDRGPAGVGTVSAASRARRFRTSLSGCGAARAQSITTKRPAYTRTAIASRFPCRSLRSRTVAAQWLAWRRLPAISPSREKPRQRSARVKSVSAWR